MDTPQPLNFSRRQWLRTAPAGFGYLAWAGLAAKEGALAATIPTPEPLPHFAPRAKRVIFLCMRGGPSQMETFDPKPELTKRQGQSGKRGHLKLFGSRWGFRQCGRSGLDVVDLLPEIGKQADKLCVLRGMHTDNENHAQALEQMHTGSFQFVRPSFGAWTVYGLGTENANLPGFISINALTALGGSRYYSSAFLPASCSAVTLGNANQPGAPLAVGDLSNADRSRAAQRARIDLMQELNRGAAGSLEDARVDGLIESYELAFRMQDQLPEVMDLTRESKATLALYGADRSPTESFGKQCLMARRFAEAGVRFIEITHVEWDLHGGLAGGMARNCAQIDRPVAGLLQDLQQRGMLEETLVVWGGEFGRTPDDPTTDGRGHNNLGYSMWLAGGGVRGGFVHGATDDLGYEAVEGKVHIHDLHATLLHLLGLDHERLTYRHGGRDYRLTDVKGNVVREVLA
jgi:hypothetical protein